MQLAPNRLALYGGAAAGVAGALAFGWYLWRTRFYPSAGRAAAAAGSSATPPARTPPPATSAGSTGLQRPDGMWSSHGSVSVVPSHGEASW